MATLITIKNIGRKTEKFNGFTVAVGATLLVDSDLEVVRKELRNDNDFIILPDSAAGTPSGGGGIVAYDSASSAIQVGDGISGGDSLTDIGLSVTHPADNALAYLLEVQLNKLQYIPFSGAAMTGNFYLLRDATPIDSLQLEGGMIDYLKTNPVRLAFEIPPAAIAHVYTVSVAASGPTDQLYVSPSGELRAALLAPLP